MKKISTYLISLVIYGGGTIALGFLAGHPTVGIVIALFVVVSLYGVSVASQLAGAETALRNPPPPGETQITFNVFDMEIAISKKFIFSPPESDGQTHNFMLNKKRPLSPFGVPTKKREEWRKWKDLYTIIKPMETLGSTWEEMMAKIQTDHNHLPSSYDTLSNVLKAGDAGLLDQFPPDIKNFRETTD